MVGHVRQSVTEQDVSGGRVREENLPRFQFTRRFYLLELLLPIRHNTRPKTLSRLLLADTRPTTTGKQLRILQQHGAYVVYWCQTKLRLDDIC